MRSVDDQEVDAGLDECVRAALGILTDTDCGADNETALGILGGVGGFVALDEVLHREQAAQAPVGVNERKLLDLLLSQDRECVIRRDSHRRGDQRHRGHHL